MRYLSTLVVATWLALLGGAAHAQAPAALPDVQCLFLGDAGHHQPKVRFPELQGVLARRGVHLTYTDRMADLNAETLGKYDVLLVYANIDTIEPAQADALLKWVENGGGFVPLHCASFCFRNDPRIVALIGGQFQRHGTGVFRPEIAQPEHPLMRRYGGFESWDETYVHTLHNEQNRTVLEYRVDSEGREPWTWVRTQGKGRVFYTAWGHDHRTWSHPGFHSLVERGIRWSAGQSLDQLPAFLEDQPFPVPKMTEIPQDAPEFEYVDVGAKIPNYTRGERWGAQGKPLNMMQKPLPAADSMRHAVTPEGFHLELFASDPELGGKPICMTWDERGRLWVAETYDYPNELQPKGAGRDRIRICEDTDHDGRADKFTVFAEQLSIPTSLTFHRGGVIVQNATETLYLKDTDGDDKADTREVLFSGWNAGDTHGGVSNFQYGLDNWVWAMQGYNTSAPVVRGERQQNFRMGFFRFRPDGSQLEFIRSTDNNTWGYGMSEEGIVFGSTANRNPSVYMPIPNRYYESVRGWTPSLVLGSMADTYLFKPVTEKVRQVDQFGGYTAGAGHALYTARTYPREYWNRAAFVNGPTGHLVGTFVLRPEGADFHSTSPFNLFASDDEWSAPIMSEVGPDGQVWVLDWYNFIVQHNPTPVGFETGKGNAYETDLRDKRHGRVYRVVYTASQRAAATPEPMTLAGASPEKLVATLRNPNLLWRRHAQRLLVERGERDVVDELIALVEDTSTDDIGLNVGAIHALWTLQGLGALDGSHERALAAAVAALRHPSAGVRRNAVQVLPIAESSVAALLAAESLDDGHAQVRLMTLLALADQSPSDAAGAAIASFISTPANLEDRWLPDAATAAAARHATGFLPAIAGSGATAPRALEVVEIVAQHVGRAGDRSAPKLIGSLAETGGPLADSIVRGIAQGWPAEAKVELTEADENALFQVSGKLTAAGRGQLARLAQRWGSEKFALILSEIREGLIATIADEDATTPRRLAAARELAEFAAGDAEVAGDLLELLTPQAPPELAAGVLAALGSMDSDAVGELLVKQFPELTPSLRKSGVALLLSRPTWTKALVAGLEQGQVELGELSLDQKQSLAQHPDMALRRQARALLEKGGGLPNADRQLVIEGLRAVAKETGDPVAGKLVYSKQCSKCHVHSGEGTRIGPDLTGMAVHPKEELLTHILDPSRSVESNFRIYTVRTGDGRVLNGLLAAESRTTIELFDAEGKKHTLLREDVERLIASTKSLMPEGFEKQVSTKELTDLLEFLTQRGKYVPVDLRKAVTISSARGMFIGKENDVERLIFPDWSPKTFHDVPFQLIDPRGGDQANVILLYGPGGPVCRAMPRSAEIPCNGPAKAIHLLSGVAGWAFPYGEKDGVSMIVRLKYADGTEEDHELRNGVHFADYIRRVDVPGSEFAFALRGQQIRYLAIEPKRPEPIATIEFVKGSDDTAPVVMAVTIETPGK